MGSLPPASHDESLIDIFNTLPSPKPSYQARNVFHAEVLHMLLDDDITGLRTKPFKYQRRSAALMFQREQGILYRENEVTSASSGINKHNKDNRDSVYDSRVGGILAEEMGSGKTLICLMLILASKYLKVEMPGFALKRTVDGEGVQSLAVLCARTVLTQAVPWEDRDEDHYDRVKELLAEQHFKHKWDSYEVSRALSSRLAKREVTDVYLSSATLVVVPGNLMVQWEDEILKHSLPSDQGGLRYLRVSDNSDIPSREELLGIDLLLISRRRFDQEVKNGLDEFGRRKVSGVRRECNCPFVSAKSNVVACRCPTDDDFYQSSLVSIHWKRIIVDEGHSMASTKSNSVLVANMLHVQSRWIVTGTPSSGLYTKSQVEGDDTKIRVSEASDLKRLGDIVCHFLKLPPYDSRKVKWPAKVDEALANGILRSVLERVMVRHRICDIEAEVPLPPLSQKIVYIKPGLYEKLSLNLFLALMASNDVTSERCDRDWLFHPTQRKPLNDFVNNMREGAFYWTGQNTAQLTETCDTARKYLDEDKVKTLEDRNLLRQVIKAAETAMASEVWKSVSLTHEMGYFTRDIPDDVAKSWSVSDELSKIGNKAVLGGDQILKMQKYVSKKAYSGSELTFGLVSEGNRVMGNYRSQKLEEYEKLTLKQKGTTTASSNVAISPSNQQHSLHSRQTKIKSKRALVDSPKANKTVASTNGILKHNKIAFIRDDYLPLPIRESKIAGVVSAKLAYLISRVLELQKTEKILIFYDRDNVGFYIAEALNIVGVQYLLYSRSGLDVQRKAEYLVTFNTTDLFRVFLLDVTQAAQGIHLGGASRVFFVNPIWQPPSVLAQAVKRAHRIGQTKPVYVETLILKGTVEEAIFNRKNEMNENDFRSKKLMVDDQKLRDVLTNASFLDITEGDEPYTPLVEPQDMFGEGKIGDVPEHPDLDIVTLRRDDVAESSPRVLRTATPEAVTVVQGEVRKERRKVRFAVDTGLEASSEDLHIVDGPYKGRDNNTTKAVDLHVLPEQKDLSEGPLQTEHSRTSIFGGSDDLHVVASDRKDLLLVNSRKRDLNGHEDRDAPTTKRIRFADEVLERTSVSSC